MKEAQARGRKNRRLSFDIPCQRGISNKFVDVGVRFVYGIPVQERNETPASRWCPANLCPLNLEKFSVNQGLAPPIQMTINITPITSAFCSSRSTSKVPSR